VLLTVRFGIGEAQSLGPVDDQDNHLLRIAAIIKVGSLRIYLIKQSRPISILLNSLAPDVVGSSAPRVFTLSLGPCCRVGAKGVSNSVSSRQSLRKTQEHGPEKERDDHIWPRPLFSIRLQGHQHCDFVRRNPCANLPLHHWDSLSGIFEHYPNIEDFKIWFKTSRVHSKRPQGPLSKRKTK
jgi:hypothetical protein